MTYFHLTDTLLALPATADPGAVEALARKINRPDSRTGYALSGSAGPRCEYEFGDDGLLSSLQIRLAFDNLHKCNFIHSTVGPALQHHGFVQIAEQSKRRPAKGAPVPWKRTEWAAAHGERIIREIRRTSTLHHLILERRFDWTASPLPSS